MKKYKLKGLTKHIRHDGIWHTFQDGNYVPEEFVPNLTKKGATFEIEEEKPTSRRGRSKKK